MVRNVDLLWKYAVCLIGYQKGVFFLLLSLRFFHQQPLQSEVEETIERIKVQTGVEGYVICNKAGQVLRRFPNMLIEEAEIYSKSMMTLTTQARGTIRDLNPKVYTTYTSLSISLLNPNCSH